MLRFALFSFASSRFPHPLSCASLRESNSRRRSLIHYHLSSPHLLHLLLCLFLFLLASAVYKMTSLYNTTTNQGFSWLEWMPPDVNTHQCGQPLCSWLFTGLATELSSLGSTLSVQLLRQGRPSQVEGLRVFVRTSASCEHHSPGDERHSAGPSPPHSPALLQSEC